MTTTFTWTIASMERLLADGTVTTVHWRAVAEDGSNLTSAYGSMGLEAPDPDAMISYEYLSPEICIGWVKDKLTPEGVAGIETGLQKELDQILQPTVAQGLPWQANLSNNEIANEDIDA
jgi:hypothetical protein